MLTAVNLVLDGTEGCTKRRLTCLPVLNCIKRPQQHQHVQRQPVADDPKRQRLETQNQRDRGLDRQHPRQPEARDHRKNVGDRVPHAVAVIIQRDGDGAIPLDDPVGIFDDFPSRFDQRGNDQSSAKKGTYRATSHSSQ